MFLGVFAAIAFVSVGVYLGFGAAYASPFQSEEGRLRRLLLERDAKAACAAKEIDEFEPWQCWWERGWPLRLGFLPRTHVRSHAIRWGVFLQLTGSSRRESALILPRAGSLSGLTSAATKVTRCVVENLAGRARFLTSRMVQFAPFWPARTLAPRFAFAAAAV